MFFLCAFFRSFDATSTKMLRVKSIKKSPPQCVFRFAKKEWDQVTSENRVATAASGPILSSE